jgi:acyl carrier protein
VSSTFDVVADIIAMTCQIPRGTIGPDSHLLRDLGIDSLDLLDVGFGVDDAFGITLPLDQWLHAVHMKGPAADSYFVVGELCRYIDNVIMIEVR